MSSLLQFGGDVRDGTVGLQFVLVRPSVPEDDTPYSTVDVETFTCRQCGREHSRIAVAYRRPVGMLGCWVIFRYLGKENVPDLSIPISVPAYPRGSRVLSDDESAKIWHS